MTLLRQLLALACVAAGPLPLFVYISIESNRPGDSSVFFMLFVVNTLFLVIFSLGRLRKKSLVRHLLLGSAISYTVIFLLFVVVAILGDSSVLKRIQEAAAILAIGFPFFFPMIGMAWLGNLCACWNEKPSPIPEGNDEAARAARRKAMLLVKAMAIVQLAILGYALIVGGIFIQKKRKADYLNWAASYGTPEQVRMALAAGADVNQKSKIGRTPLTRALEERKTPDPEVVKTLIQAGAEVNARNWVGRTMLMHACEVGDAKNVVLLLKAGADAKAKDENGKTALHYLSGKTPAEAEAIQALIQAGADVNTRDQEGNTLLIVMLDRRACLECVQVLLQAGADAKAANRKGETALINTPGCSCCKSGDPRIVAALLKAGADINDQDQDGRNVVMKAVANDPSLDFFNTLVQAGADLSAKSHSGRTLLMAAAETSRTPAILEALLKAGQEVNARDRDGKTPLLMAANYNETPEVFRLLFKAGADIQAKDQEGATALHLAAGHNENQEVIEILLKAGAEINARDNAGRTPLMLAAHNNRNSNITAALLRAGADPNATDNAGQSARDHARNNTNPAVPNRLPAASAK